MATYLETQTRIANELSRSDLTAEIKLAILTSIEYYKRRRFWWNESTTTDVTVASTAYVALPTDLVELDMLQITIGSNITELDKRSYDEIVTWRANSSAGQPTDFALYQNRVELYRVPDDVYTLTFHYVKQLTTLSADADTNTWLTEGEELIRCHAKKILYVHNLRNTAAGQDMQAMEDQVLLRLESHNQRRTATGKTRSYYL